MSAAGCSLGAGALSGLSPLARPSLCKEAAVPRQFWDKPLGTTIQYPWAPLGSTRSRLAAAILCPVSCLPSAGFYDALEGPQQAAVEEPLKAAAGAAAAAAGAAPAKSAPAASRAAKEITCLILDAASTCRLQQVLAAHAADLDHIHVSAALNKAVKLQRQQQQQEQAGPSELGPQLLSWQQAPLDSYLPSSAPTAAAAAAAAALSPARGGELQAAHSPSFPPPPADLKAQLLSLTASKLQAMGPRQLPVVLHSLAKLGWRDQPRLLKQLLIACNSHFHYFTPQGLTNTLYSCVLLNVRPSTKWLQAWLRASRRQLPGFNSQDLALCSWALGRLGAYPRREWEVDLYAACQAKFSSFKPGELVALALGLVGSYCKPPQRWLAALGTQLLRGLPLLQPLEVSNVLWALTRLGYKPSDVLLKAVRVALEQQGEGLTAKTQAEDEQQQKLHPRDYKEGQQQQLQTLKQQQGHQAVPAGHQHQQQQRVDGLLQQQQVAQPCPAAQQQQHHGWNGTSLTVAQGDPHVPVQTLWSLAHLNLRGPLLVSDQGFGRAWVQQLQMELLTGAQLGSAGAACCPASPAAASSWQDVGRESSRIRTGDEAWGGSRLQGVGLEDEGPGLRGSLGPGAAAALAGALAGAATRAAARREGFSSQQQEEQDQQPQQQQQQQQGLADWKGIAGSSPEMLRPLQSAPSTAAGTAATRGQATPLVATPLQQQQQQQSTASITTALCGSDKTRSNGSSFNVNSSSSSSVAPGGLRDARPLSLSCLQCSMLIIAVGRLQEPIWLLPGLLPYWLQQAKQQLEAAGPGDLACWMWGLGRLRYRPSEAWLSGFFAAVRGCMQQLRPQEVVMLLWGMSRLQVVPNIVWLAGLLEEVAEQVCDYKARELALLVSSLGMLRLKPNKEFMNLVLDAVFTRFSKCSSKDMVGLIVGLQRMGYSPSRRWMKAYLFNLAGKQKMMKPSEKRIIMSHLDAMGWEGWRVKEALIAAL